MKLEVNDKCPACGFAAMPSDAEAGDAVACPTCGERLNVCGRFLHGDTVFRAWLDTEARLRAKLRKETP